MMIKHPYVLRIGILISLIVSLIAISSSLKADSGNCGGRIITLPFTDVAGNAFFCQIAGAYFSDLLNDSKPPTTYGPNATVTRDQMAGVITRTQDSALKRGNRRAALNQWWTTKPHWDLN